MNPETALLNLLASGIESGAMAFLAQHGVKGDWFIESKNRIIFETCEKLQASGVGIDPVNITHELKRTGLFEMAGGSTHLSAVCDCYGTMAHASHYIQLVREGRTRRELHLLGKELQAAIANPEEQTVAEIVAKASERLTDIAMVRGQAKSYREVADAAIGQWEAIARGEQVSLGFDSGIQQMDEAGQVLEPGNLVIVAGRPSAGKTTFEGQIARHVALFEGRGVYRVTRDATQAGLVRRDLCAMTPGMTLHRAKTNGLLPEHFAKLHENAAALGAGKIWVDDRARYLEDMLIQCRMMKARHDVSLVTVDYAQLVEVANMDGRSKDDERKVISRVTGSFKALAIELGIPVLILAQLSRGAEEDETKPPRMRDLKGSGSIEQDAEVILFLYRAVKFQYGVPYYSPARNPDGSTVMDYIGGRYVPRMDKGSEAVLQYTDPRRPITLTKAKHKDGALGEWPLWLDAGFFSFSPAWEAHGQPHLQGQR